MDGRDGASDAPEPQRVHRRAFLKIGAVGSAALAVGTAGSLIVPDLKRRGLWTPDGLFDAASIAFANAIYTEAFPTSPLILTPFRDVLPVPKALAPVPKSEYSGWAKPPGPGDGQQNSLSGNNSERHQIWTPPGTTAVDPVVYHIKVQVDQHAFTSSQVLPIDQFGKPTASFDSTGKTFRAGTVRTLPKSTIYGFNGTFPGPMINAEYGKPCLVRFDNHLHENPQNLDRQDFGAPDWSFLTHLHNGHTAPESDGNPHYSMRYGPKSHGYAPQLWVDNLYLNWPAGGQDCEKQSFFWFHDHRMDHTGSNVYKGLVGLYPIYDPKNGMDMGDETQGLRLPGVRTNNADGSFDVAYDIPLAFYDCRLDDGVTIHQDIHDGQGEFPLAGNPRKHPEWWGKTFYKHFPNHGFTGDIFTVNGTAYPVLEVKRRKYRFRILNASVSRSFRLSLSTGDPMTVIGTDSGLMPFPVKTTNFRHAMAERYDVVIDFAKYKPRTRVTLRNTSPKNNVNYTNTNVVMAFDVVADVFDPTNNSVPSELNPTCPTMALQVSEAEQTRRFKLERRKGTWTINGTTWDKVVASNYRHVEASVKKDSVEIWEFENDSGGWFHPLHVHLVDFKILSRNGVAPFAYEQGPKDVVYVGENELVRCLIKFEGSGKYMIHCHNLIHEDHDMMTQFEVIDPVYPADDPFSAPCKNLPEEYEL